MFDKLENTGSTIKIFKISAILILLISSALLPAYAVIRLKSKQQTQTLEQNIVETVAVDVTTPPTISDQSELGILIDTDTQQPDTTNTETPVETPITTPLPTTAPTAQTTTQPLTIPTSKTISGGTHSFQTFNNCGPAAMSMALSFFDISQSQQTLGSSLRPYQHAKGNNDDKSVTLQEIAKKKLKNMDWLPMSDLLEHPKLLKHLLHTIFL